MLKYKPASMNGISRKLLSQACARNYAVDLFNTEDEPIGRSRLLTIREQDLLIDQPVREGRPVSLLPGVRLIVHLSREGSRWSFRTRVVEHKRVRLNPKVVVDAVAVTVPSTVRLSQRRRYYRVPLAVEGEVLCRLSEIPEERHADEEPAPADPEQSPESGHPTHEETSGGDSPELGEQVGRRVMEAQVVNLSEGGLAVAFDKGEALRPKAGEMVRVQLELSDGGQPLVFDAEVRHRRLIRRTGRFVAGMRFRDFLQPADVEQAAMRIGRFVARMQRRHLARMSARR